MYESRLPGPWPGGVLERVSQRARLVFRDGGAITGCVARRVMLRRSQLRTGEVENKQTHHGFGGN